MQNPILYLFRKMWIYSKGNRKNVVLFFVLFLFANIIWLLEPFLVAKVLNLIQEYGITADTLPTISGLLLLFIVIQIAAWSFHGPARMIETNNAFLVRTNYKKYLLDGILSLPQSWHTDHHSGDTIDKVEKGSQALYKFCRHSFEIISAVVKFLVSFAVLAYFNVHSTYILILMFVLTIFLVNKFDNILIKKLDLLNKHENAVSAKVYDTISNITTITILRIEKLVSSSIYKRMMKPFELYKEERRLNEWKWFAVSIAAPLTVFFVLVSYMMINIKAGNVVLIGTFYLLYEYVYRIVGIFFSFAYTYGTIVEEKTAVKNAEVLEEEFGSIKKVKEVKLDKKWKEIVVEGLNFSYHSKETDLHLDDISFAFKKGEKVAFVGESGSGKTTTLKIIRGLYSPNKVDVLVDGKKLKNSFLSIGRYISLIPQDPEIFNSTIKENITFGVRHTDKYIDKFTRMAKFSQVISRLPKKMNSLVVEKGVNLSGGEKQRLALSRGLLASLDKEIILLDEPTSSVDPKNEREIYRNIFKEFKDKTVISSIHRLHLLSMFDKVILFENGRVVDIGSFSELKEKSALFKKMWGNYEDSYGEG